MIKAPHTATMDAAPSRTPGRGLRSLRLRAAPKGFEAGRWVARVYLCIALLLIPWGAYLAVSMPDRNMANNYAIAWSGFDCLLIVAMARTAWCAHTRRPQIGLPATAAATLLIVDAWFDVTTAPPGLPLTQAVALALFAELPAAALSIRIARRAHVDLASRAALTPVAYWADAPSRVPARRSTRVVVGAEGSSEGED